MPAYKILTAGDTALVIELGDDMNRQVNLLTLAFARRLKERRIEGIMEIVPTFRSVMLYYEPLVLPTAALVARVAELMEGLAATEQTGRLWRLPVCYDFDLAPDLADVAARTGLTAAAVVERHAAVTYHVYMLGFLPGLGYLGDVPKELALPRRELPRVRIPPGSLGIALTMCCIMPRETPSGLHLIGRSPVALWRPRPGGEIGALLAPGDRVTFDPVSLREYGHLHTQAAEGRLVIAPVEDARVTAA
jgi:inhibitor of KinA